MVEAIGKDRLAAVAYQIVQKKYQVDCDIAAVGYGLVPNNELAAVLGCETRDGYVVVDNEQQTTVNNVFGAGETTGIGGVEKSMIEGEIAGLRSTGQPADHCWRRRNRSWQFVKLLEKASVFLPLLRTWRLTTPSCVAGKMLASARLADTKIGVWRSCSAGSGWDRARAESAARHFPFSAATGSRTPNGRRLDRLSLQLT